jgi:membrane protein DedA with SNARE-associated domain
MKKKTLAIVVAIVVIVLTIVLLFIRLEHIRGLMYAFMHLGYLGTFLAGFLGTSSLMISFCPPQVIVFLMSAPRLGFNPLLLGVTAGLGAGIAQYMHYYVGSAGKFLLSEKQKKMMERWKPRVAKYGLILIFLFAATPLTPDDVIWIPLGMMNYPKVKALIAAIFGKTIMLVICAYGGYYGIGLVEKYFIS